MQKHTPKATHLQPFSGELKFAAMECDFRAVNRLFRHRTHTKAGRTKLKIEINGKEHFNVEDWVDFSFSVENAWFSGSSKIKTYSLNELLGTKLRALYQRKKGRDLFDLDYARRNAELDLDLIIKSFNAYMKFSTGHIPTRREFEMNIEEKENDPIFTGDMEALLRSDIRYDQGAAFVWLKDSLISMLR